jgi:hypothetical protein
MYDNGVYQDLASIHAIIRREQFAPEGLAWLGCSLLFCR